MDRWNPCTQVTPLLLIPIYAPIPITLIIRPLHAGSSPSVIPYILPSQKFLASVMLTNYPSNLLLLAHRRLEQTSIDDTLFERFGHTILLLHININIIEYCGYQKTRKVSCIGEPIGF